MKIMFKMLFRAVKVVDCAFFYCIDKFNYFNEALFNLLYPSKFIKYIIKSTKEAWSETLGK